MDAKLRQALLEKAAESEDGSIPCVVLSRGRGRKEKHYIDLLCGEGLMVWETEQVARLTIKGHQAVQPVREGRIKRMGTMLIQALLEKAAESEDGSIPCVVLSHGRGRKEKHHLDLLWDEGLMVWETEQVACLTIKGHQAVQPVREGRINWDRFKEACWETGTGITGALIAGAANSVGA